jgi:short-subunit dehydrogenase
VTKNILIIGSSGGIGSACCNLLGQNSEYNLTCWNSSDLDLNFPDRIFEKDLRSFDVIVNCAAHNQGTYQGFLKNTWQNQLSQIMVNYASNLFLLKHYANSRTSGKYVWCSTDMSSGVTPYKSVYLSTKVAGQFAMDLIQQEATHISILEAQFKSVKTNLRYRNFEGTLSPDQIENTYDADPLTADYVAKNILQAIDNNLKKVLIE